VGSGGAQRGEQGGEEDREREQSTAVADLAGQPPVAMLDEIGGDGGRGAVGWTG
jgi:hypothetical protein